MVDQLAVVRLPPLEVAPGYRASLAERSHFAVEDMGGGIVTVAPAAGAGAIEEHFRLHRICDARTDLNDHAVWAPFHEQPPRVREMGDAEEYRDRMMERAQETMDVSPGSPEAAFTAFAMQAFGAAEVGAIEELIRVQLPVLFKTFPDGCLLYVTVSDELLARLAFGRAQMAFHLAPDIEPGEELDQLRAFEDLTLTRGIDSTAVMQFPLLAFSPSALGVVLPALPHALVFCFGSAIDLRKPYPHSFPSLYRPRVFNSPEGLNRAALFEGERPDDGPRLVQWWVGRLNILYSHITDPTRWTDIGGYHDAAKQTAWLVTVERLLGDAIALMGEPQATELDRVQMAFDLLDKAEALLGYGRDDSGKGFAWLLRRSDALPRLTSALRSLPEDLADRLGAEIGRLFDGLYDRVRANTLRHRLTPRGARMARRDAAELHAIDNDSLVSSLCRAVRNSSHGLLEILESRPERFLLAANTDGIPAELPALAPLIALSLVADAEALNAGTWKPQAN